jgi:hypothetical protein
MSHRDAPAPQHKPAEASSKDPRQPGARAPASPKDSRQQDTPGRPSSKGSRQQTHPDQGSQTGSPEVDSRSKDPPSTTGHVRNEK